MSIGNDPPLEIRRKHLPDRRRNRYNAHMHLERDKAYRASTAGGHQITFTVLDPGRQGWATVDLDSAEGPEPNVWLNTNQLLWISSEMRQKAAIRKATEEVIEALEDTAGQPM